MRWVVPILMLLAATGAMAGDVVVSAAISLKDSLETIRPKYELASGDHVKFTFASSGQLAAQIQSGAPVDLFLSAARKQVDDLKQAGKADDSTAVVFAGNELVLIVPAGAKSPAAFEELNKPTVKRIAMGEPKTVPAGEYAQQVLKHLKLTETLHDKLVYGMNVRQVLQYVQSNEVDAGIVYRSDAQSVGEKVTVVATADPTWHQPIEYWGVVIEGSANGAEARRFLKFLHSEPGQTILKANGFSEPKNGPTTAPAK